MPVSDWVQMAAGVKRRLREDGQQLMLVEVHFEAGAAVPEHQHVHEQISFVASGRMMFTMNGQDLEIAAGGSLHVPAGVPHAARALEPSVVLDAFSPPRDDLRQ